MDRAVIDRLYAGAPDERRRQLLDFLETHPPRTAHMAGVPFHYIASGAGARAVLLLPGLLGDAGSVYRQVLDLEADHRVIAVTYPDLDDVDAQLEAISTVLEAEGVERVVVVGTTLGGYLGQVWAWRNLRRVEGLALVHAGLPDRRLGKRVERDLLWLRWLPDAVLRRYVREVLLRKVASLHSSGQIGGDDARTAAAHFRHRFARLTNRRRILNRYRLITRLHATPVPDAADLGHLAGRVLVVYAEGNVFTRDLDGLRERYPRAREVRLGEGHNLSFLIKPGEAKAALREFLALLPSVESSNQRDQTSWKSSVKT